MSTIELGSKKLSVEDIEAVARGAPVSISAKALKNFKANASFFSSRAASETIYGFATGFGPMEEHAVPESAREDLQKNLIRSHALGMGEYLSQEDVRAVMAVRLASLLAGYSGIYADLPLLLAALLNKKITPRIPAHGSVGASGDLVQLAHVGLVLLGEGEVLYKGKIVPAHAALAREKIKPVRVKTREGLALMNGTAAMTGIAAITLARAERLLRVALLLSALLYEISGAYEDYIAEEVAAARPHGGQRYVMKRMRALLSGSRRLTKRHAHGQHPYSIRCAPQVLGPIADTLHTARMIVETEIRSATDNPLTVTGKGIYHAGNFHGDYVAFEMDKIKIAFTKLSILSERHVNYLSNPALNGILPPFVNQGTPGIDLGLQGLQFVATSTAAENQTLSMPASIHSIPSNNENQDIVSMGTNAAILARKVLDNAFQVLTVEAVFIAYAIEHLGIEKDLGRGTRAFFRSLKKYIPANQKTLSAKDLARMEQFLALEM